MLASKPYEFLNDGTGIPKMVLEFLNILGTEETYGVGDNPMILKWAIETGCEKIYEHDYIPWCGLTMALIAKRAGKDVPKGFLWALNWLHFGRPVADPMLSDILVFQRTNGGHVGLYIAESEGTYHVGGGNQKDMVCISEIDKKRLVGARRSVWKIAQPEGVKKIFITSDNKVTSNEA